MNKVELLLNAAANLRNLADSIWAIGEAIEVNEAPVQTEQPAVKTISLEEVRAVLAEKSHDGFTAEVRSLLEKHGATRLSEIDPSRYAALLADAEDLK